ncbi:unnamed protein product [Arctogadus glacialis]
MRLSCRPWSAQGSDEYSWHRKANDTNDDRHGMCGGLRRSERGGVGEYRDVNHAAWHESSHKASSSSSPTHSDPSSQQIPEASGNNKVSGRTEGTRPSLHPEVMEKVGAPTLALHPGITWDAAGLTPPRGDGEGRGPNSGSAPWDHMGRRGPHSTPR